MSNKSFAGEKPRKVIASAIIQFWIEMLRCRFLCSFFILMLDFSNAKLLDLEVLQAMSKIVEASENRIKEAMYQFVEASENRTKES
jgi:hypothetical protein